MANATALTINELTANGWAARATGDVLDSGTIAVTLYGTVDTYRHGAVIVEVSAGGTANLVCAALAGDLPPAHRSGLGYVEGTVAGGSAQIFGPFEAARFMQNDGTFGMSFAPSDGTIAGTVRAYALPIV